MAVYLKEEDENLQQAPQQPLADKNPLNWWEEPITYQLNAWQIARITLSATACTTVIGTGLYVYWKTRNITQKISKYIIWLNIAVAIFIFVSNVLSIVLTERMSKLVFRLIYVMNYLSIHYINGVCHTYFVKIQVQLKASYEVTKKIIEHIKAAERLITFIFMVPMLQFVYFWLYIQPQFYYIAIVLDICWFLVVIGWIKLCLGIVRQLNYFFERSHLPFPKLKISIYIVIAGLLILPNEQRFNIYAYTWTRTQGRDQLPYWSLILYEITKLCAIMSGWMFNESMIWVIWFLSDVDYIGSGAINDDEMEGGHDLTQQLLANHSFRGNNVQSTTQNPVNFTVDDNSFIGTNTESAYTAKSRSNKHLLDDDASSDLSASFKSIHEVNRPWSYQRANGHAYSFDCTDCIQLELGFFIHEKNKENEKYRKTQIIMGEVDYNDLTISVKNEKGEDETLKVFRSESSDGVRRRPEEDMRHDRSIGGLISDQRINDAFIHNTNLEWLSLNWRKYRASQISNSLRRLMQFMFEEMLQMNLGYFPTLREIRDGLIGGQLQELENDRHYWNDKTRFGTVKQLYVDNWKKVFQFKDLGKLDKPLSTTILMNPEHPVTRHIFYVYSMSSFVYPALNRTCRSKNQNNIQHYGAFAAALSCILYFANKNRKGERLSGTTELYRGLQLPPDEVDGYKEGKMISLTGYTSTSMSYDVAKDFALTDVPENKVAVLYHIKFTGDEGLFYMSDPRFTAFMEDEVLVQDGFEYRIDRVDEHIDEGTQQKLIVMELSYPAIPDKQIEKIKNTMKKE